MRKVKAYGKFFKILIYKFNLSNQAITPRVKSYQSYNFHKIDKIWVVWS